MTDPQTSHKSLRLLPPVHALLDSAPAQTLIEIYPRSYVREAIRRQLDAVRAKIVHEPASASPWIWSEAAFFTEVEQQLLKNDSSRLQRVINATGIVLHTNLGRAILAPEAAAAAHAAGSGFTNLELDLLTGKRGGRGGQIGEILCRLTGAEAALVVNNNAAAVLLALGTMAGGGEVVISRGELVEIGGAFRIPDVIRQSGARLVEVGATNKTRLSDYRDAITDETRVLLKVHASNFRIVGFTAEVDVPTLAGLGRERNLPVMLDLGSGAIVDLAQYGLPHEPTVVEAITAGADIVAFSGDKLLGGPQCGIIVGNANWIDKMARNPLFRALRADKMTLAALETTLRLYESPETLREKLPVLRMLTLPLEELDRRARTLSRALGDFTGIEAEVIDGVSFTGGGSLPEVGLPTRLVRVRASQIGNSASRLAEALRRNRPAIIGVIGNDWLTLDVRTLSIGEIQEVIDAFAALTAIP